MSMEGRGELSKDPAPGAQRGPIWKVRMLGLSFWEAGQTGWTPPETRPRIYPGSTGPVLSYIDLPGRH